MVYSNMALSISGICTKRIMDLPDLCHKVGTMSAQIHTNKNVIHGSNIATVVQGQDAK